MHLQGSVKSAYLAATSYAFIIGFSFMFVKITVATVHPLDVLAHRFMIGLIALLIPVLLGKVRITVTMKEVWRIVPLGVLSPILFFLFQTFGLLNASSGEAGIIVSLVPLFTLPMAMLFLKERSNLRQQLSLLLSVAGAVLIFAMKGDLGGARLEGIALLLLSALSFAGYGVLARPLVRKHAPLELAFITTAMGFIAFNGAALFRHIGAGTIDGYFQPFGDRPYLLALLYLGILSSVGTTVLSSYALRFLEASKVSVFGNLATLISLLAGAIILHESLGWYHVLGTLMILGGIWGTNRGKVASKPDNGKKASHETVTRM
ncbi:EamA family transporter [Paenibacillaceae bacterium]|nr:EamA family transporter [Paenibacillaceae bacterium]